jgi:hypothetical protein
MKQAILRRPRFYSLIFFSLCLVLTFSSCTIGVRRAPFHWPMVVERMEGSGDIDLSWGGRKLSGSFGLHLESPSLFLFEAYGPFGQTLLQVKKEGESVNILTPEGKVENDRFFEQQYGMSVDNFIDDLTRKGVVRETPEGTYLDRDGYRVSYSTIRDRGRICWLNPEGTICLTFTEIKIDGNRQNSEGSRR